MNRDDRAAVRKAARMLREGGRLLFESCEISAHDGKPARPWACDDCQKDADGKCIAQRDHDNQLATARRLMAIASKNQRS